MHLAASIRPFGAPWVTYLGTPLMLGAVRLARMAASATARVRALSEVVGLSLSRGAGPSLMVIDYLTSVHQAGLKKVTLRDFLQELVTDGGTWPAQVVIHPQLTGVGSGTTADMTALASLVATCRPRQVLEFGTCEGAATWHLWANAAADARITTLDLPAGTHVKGSTDLNLQGRRSRPLLPSDPRVRLIEQDTRSWVPDVRDVDFCFIDAGHSYECVKNDTEKALTVMAPGGLVVWHDASWSRDGYAVNRYLKELRSGGRDVVLLHTGHLDICLLACLRA
jgi:predicted O-methyltransferase YrrM